MPYYSCAGYKGTNRKEIYYVSDLKTAMASQNASFTFLCRFDVSIVIRENSLFFMTMTWVSGLVFLFRRQWWNQVKSSEIKWNQVKSGEIRWNQVKSSEIRWNRWNQVKSLKSSEITEIKWNQVKSSEIKWNQVKSSEIKRNQAKSLQNTWNLSFRDRISENLFIVWGIMFTEKWHSEAWRSKKYTVNTEMKMGSDK